MINTTVVCDGCAGVISEPFITPILFVEEYEIEYGGGSTRYAYPDLCLKCATKLVRNLIVGLSESEQAKLAKKYPTARVS